VSVKTGQDLYFHLNHPIKWVRIVGIVVAIDEWSGCRIYTIDDSSGATIECVINIPKHPTSTTLQTSKQEDAAAREGKATVAAAQATTTEEDKRPVVDREIDVGDVLDVRGSIIKFRDTKKIKVTKVIHLRSTAEEVQFWDKLVQFGGEVLARPWVLSEKEVRRCRKEAEGTVEGRAERRREKESRRKVDKFGGAAKGLESKRKARQVVDTATGLESQRKVRAVDSFAAMGLESKSKTGEIDRTATGLESRRKVREVDNTVTGLEGKRSSATGLESKRKARDAGNTVTGLETKRAVREVHNPATGLEAKRAIRKPTPASDGGSASRPRATGLERKLKRPKTVVVDGKYGTLGI
jgi:hypothetical protein